MSKRITQKKTSTEAIGTELLETARERSDAALPLSTKLFPYIFVASRRMSLRAISRWLEEEHKVSLSAGAISRALSSPDLHLERLAESIAAPAQYIATVYGHRPMDLLFQEIAENVTNAPTQIEYLSNTQPEGERDIPRWMEMQDLAAIWIPIPHEVQLLLEPYLRELFFDPENGEF